MQEPRTRKYVIVVEDAEVEAAHVVEAWISWGLFGAAAAMVVVTALFCG